jgi:lysophospholipase L1-like esterase
MNPAMLRLLLLGTLLSALPGCGGGAGAPGRAADPAAGGTSGGVGGSVSTGGSGAGGTVTTGGAGVGGNSGSAVGGSGGSTGGSSATGGSGATAGTGSDVDHQGSGVIVVLGSSTAAGSGPTDPNNAWVVRYTAYLAEEFPNFELTNLAQGGYTTFQIQPTGYTPPDGRPGPDSARNITAALALDPDAIIVNMPSNDQASNFPLAEQLDNYDRIAELATEQGVQLWVTTTQPRNLSDEQRTALMQARDAISEKFGEFSIDFWTSFAEENGTIMPEYNSGDGTHLNDAAHAILRDLVVLEEVPETVLAVEN